MIRTKFSEDDCIDYMKKKYGSDFVCAGPVDDFQPNAYSLNIYVTTPELPGRNIFVVEEDTGESLRFRDNYPAVRYEDEVRSLVTELSQKVYGRCKVFYNRLLRRVIADEPKSFGEYISLEKSLIHFSVLLPSEAAGNDKEAKAKELAAELCRKGMVCSFSVYYSELYEKLSSSGEFPNTQDWYSACGNISTDGSSIKSAEWR